MLTVDASQGEGGGQIVRTALALSVSVGRPVRLRGIRARRPKPGLQPQHLTVVRALAAVSGAQVAGDALGSGELTFVPHAVLPGRYRFDVGAVRGSAGSVALLFQSLLLPLARAGEPSELTLIGGTHVPWSPPVHYLTGVFLPALREVGVHADLTLNRWGWYPRGGGEIACRIRPSAGWDGLRWTDTRPGCTISGISAVSRLPLHIAERQRRRALDRLREHGLDADIALVDDRQAFGPGTVIFLAVSGARMRAGFSALGRRGVPAETVADEAVDAVVTYLASGAAVDDHLADQLVPFLALARTPSSFTCPSLSSHLRTVGRVVEQFLPVEIAVDAGPPAVVRVTPRQPREDVGR
jgi:RNA 3'-terminal phosphate cyclase (ATP)